MNGREGSDWFRCCPFLQEFELRKHARQEGRRYCDPVVLTYQAERMPEQIRLKVGTTIAYCGQAILTYTSVIPWLTVLVLCRWEEWTPSSWLCMRSLPGMFQASSRAMTSLNPPASWLNP